MSVQPKGAPLFDYIRLLGKPVNTVLSTFRSVAVPFLCEEMADDEQGILLEGGTVLLRYEDDGSEVAAVDYRGGEPGESFPGTLPAGLFWFMSRVMVRARFGMPLRTYEEVATPWAAPVLARDIFRWDNYLLCATYTSGEQRLLYLGVELVPEEYRH